MLALNELTTHILSKKAVIFDMDGTMVNNLAYHARAWKSLFDQENIETNFEDLYHGLVGTSSEYLASVTGTKVDDPLLKKMEERKEAIYRDLYQKSIAEVVGLTPFLKALKHKTFKIGLATLSNKQNADLVLDKLNVGFYFDDIKTADDVQFGKPNPEIYLKSLTALNVEPQDAIVFEDSKGGIMAAKAANIEVVGMETVNSSATLQKWGVLSTTPDFLFAKFE